ncbi:50S ribosomal protein L3, partial [Candidatus Bathyarchaeota archaeon]|nr:50S ribosomal protein L3 [Candidatus Bathyarchaeota archaeon]
MGRRRINAPRHGSLAYLPRGRAKRPIGRINHWPGVEAESPKLIGFAGYKVGMSFAFMISTLRGSPTFGQEIYSPVTFLETPPMLVCGFRFYSETPHGLKAKNEVWAEKPPKDLERVLTLPANSDISSLQDIEANLDAKTELRAIVCTQPRLGNVPQKKPELFEVKVVGGTLKDQFDYLKNLLGKEVGLSAIFKEGQPIDVITVTKGKGIQGPVKRWGVKTLPHKSRKTVRGVGTLGAWTPHYVMYTVPRAGQMGFHQRTERNKMILKIGENTQPFAPKGGFPHYGLIRSNYLVLKGSIPGPAKRLVKMRYADRPPTIIPDAAP